MNCRSTVALCAGVVASLVAVSEAGPAILYQSADRYVEGWVDATHTNPPGDVHDRLDADGFMPFDVNFTVGFFDDEGDGALARVRQTSSLYRHGMVISGSVDSNDGGPAGTSFAWTHSYFDVQFQVDQSGWVPLTLTLHNIEAVFGTNVDLTGLGVDFHLHPEYADGGDIQVAQSFWLTAGETYVFTVDAYSDNGGSLFPTTFSAQLGVPAPGALIVLATCPILGRRRRKA